MKIDAETGWFRGVGDIVCYAWIGEGIQAAGKDVQFYVTKAWRNELFELFGMKTTGNPTGAIVTHDGYEQAIGDGSPLNYLEWITEKLGVKETPRRPRLNMVPMDRELGRRASANVLIFPHGVWPPRVWPKNYFIELALMLTTRGYTVKIVTEERDYDFLSFHCIYKKSWSFIAAAIQWADLVIGNDSGPAHLAGTIGTRALAIHGPTQERIYGYVPEVTSYRKKALPCAGCHCLPPFPKAYACSVGCAELYRTFPEDVYEVAVGILGEPRKTTGSNIPACGHIRGEPLGKVA